MIKRKEETPISVRNSKKLFDEATEEGLAIYSEGLLLEINGALERILGRPREEIVGKHFRDFLTEQSRVNLDQHKDSVHLIIEILGTEGNIIQTEVKTGTVRHENASVQILKLRRLDLDSTIDQALRESENRWRMLVENSPERILVVDRDGYIKFINRVIVERKLKDVIGSCIYDYLSPDESDRLREFYRRVFENGDHVNFELGVPNNSGTVDWFQTSMVPLRRKDDIIEALSISTDITQHKKVEQALRESEAKFRTLADESPNMIFINQLGRVVYVNQKTVELMEYSFEEFYSKEFDFISVIHSDYHDKIFENLQIHKNGGEVEPLEYRILTKSGRTLDALIATNLIRYDGANAILGVITDITERKRAEEEIQRFNERLVEMVAQRSQRIKDLERQRSAMEKSAVAGRMAARIAHEINNPLAGVKKAFNLIGSAIPADHRYFSYVARVDKEINRIVAIIDQMYSLYKPDQEPKSEFLLADILQDIIIMLQPKLEEYEVSIKLSHSSEKNIIYLAENLLRQIIYNVAANAIEASPPGGTIIIDVSTENRRIRLSVTDQGKGISAETRSQIYDPFFSTKSHLKGTGLGLGLSLTKSLLEAIHGTISFHDAAGGGTVFEIEIPFNESPED